MAIKNRHVKAVIQLRRALEEEWINFNPILRLGEPALSTDVYKLKIGDGQTHWLDLDYLGDSDYNELMAHITALEENDIIDCGTSTTVI